MDRPNNVDAPPVRRCCRLLLFSILAYGFLFRLAFLFDPYRADEWFTFYNFAKFPLSEIGKLYSNTNNHFLNSMLVHMCYRTMGLSELSLRLPAFLSGMAAMYATYEVARRVQDDPIVPLVACCLVAGSSTFLLYSVYSRGYMLQAALALAVLLVVSRENAWEEWWNAPLVLAAGGFLILYAVPSGIVFVLPLYIWLFMTPASRPAKKARAAVFYSGVGIVLLVVTAFSDVVSNFPALAAYNKYPIGNLQFLKETGSLMSGGLLPLPLLLAAVAVGIYTFPASTRSMLMVLSLSYLVFAVVASHLVVQLRFFPRSYIVLFPFLYIFAGRGIVILLRRAAAHRAGRWLAWIAGAALATNLAWANVHLMTHKEELEQGDPYRFYYRTLTERLTDHLKDDEIIQGTDKLSDTMGAIYTVQQVGFSGHYGLSNIRRGTVHAVYLIGPNRDSVLSFFQQTLAGRGWSAPVLTLQDGPAVACRTDELPKR